MRDVHQDDLPRAEIDEAAWASLYRTESRPFPSPETGKIAVKAIPGDQSPGSTYETPSGLNTGARFPQSRRDFVG